MLVKRASPKYNNPSHANDAVGADQLDQGVLGRALGVALAISRDVAQVTNVTGLIGGSTVGLAVRVDYGEGAGQQPFH